MQINRGPLRAQLRVEKAAQRGREGGVAFLVHPAVPDEDGVGLQILAVLAQESRQRRAADLFLSLDQESHVHGQAAGCDQVLDRLDGRHVVALVVRCPARPQVALTDRRLERW